MLTDDEKFFHTPKLTLKEAHRFAEQNALDIIAIGFDPKKTFIFADTQFIDSGFAAAFNANVREMGKRTTNNQIKGTFGFNDSNNIAEFAFPAMQSATAFATSFPFIFGPDPKKVAKIPCLIPCAIDQDPYFRQCRDNAPRIGLIKPAIIHTVFLPSLKGSESKMSASDADSSIFLSDTDNQIKKKINKAFSGGQDTIELHKEIGGRTDVDVPYQYLTFYLEDDEELERLRQAYEKGEIASGEMKAACIKELQAYVSGFKERRKLVTEHIRDEFMRPRQLVFKGMPSESEQKAARAKRIEVLEAELRRLREEE
jgi:tryptophanyl-tRNA synthetase